MTTTHTTLSRPIAARFASSMPELNDGFAWATRRALDWVQTGRTPETMPSYWAGLTDRPMFYSRDVAHQLLGAHLLGLDEENHAMLRHFAASSTARRQHYPLWAFTFDGGIAAIDYNSDDNFVREVPAVFELVEKSLEQFQWTGDRRYVDDEVMLDFYARSIREFVAAHDVLGIGVAGEYGAGDIFLGSPTYNERAGGPELRLAADGLSSQWAAAERVADVLGAEGHAELAAFARAEAERLRDIHNTDWWEDALGRYRTGVAEDGPVTVFGLEASWFPAVKAIMPAGERADAHLDFVSAGLVADLPDNIEAITYLPEAYLAYDKNDEALRWIRHLIDSRADYPEVSYTVVAHLVSGLTGLVPTGENAVTTRSHVPEGEWVEAADVVVQGSVLTVRQEGGSATELAVAAGGAPVRWRAEFPGGETAEAVVAPGERVRLVRGPHPTH